MASPGDFSSGSTMVAEFRTLTIARRTSQLVLTPLNSPIIDPLGSLPDGVRSFHSSVQKRSYHDLYLLRDVPPSDHPHRRYRRDAAQRSGRTQYQPSSRLSEPRPSAG